MPTLKATGRGRLGPAVARTPSTESTSWKPKTTTTLNGSTSSSAINRGPPPQPPPANKKPTTVVLQFLFN